MLPTRGIITISDDDSVMLLGDVREIDYYHRLGCTEYVIKGCVGHFPMVSSKMDIKRVIFNDPATIVLWKDGTKTVVKCQKGDTYDPEKGLAFCIIKKIFGNKGKFNDIFRQWIPKNDTPKVEKSASETDFCGKFTENAPEREEKPTRGRARKVDVGKIYALHKAHWSAEEIADEMGISVATVYKYLREIKQTRDHNRYHSEMNV